MGEKSSKKIKYKEKKGKEGKAPKEAGFAEYVQSEEKTNGEVEKEEKVKKKKLRSHHICGVSEKMEESAMDGKKEKKKKKERKKEEFRSDGNDPTFMAAQDVIESEVNIVEKKNNKRKRIVDGEDLGKKEKRSKRMSKGNRDGLEKDVHNEKMINLSHDNLKRKGKMSDENRDNMLLERDEDKYEMKKKKKKDKNGTANYIEKEINEEEEKGGQTKGSKRRKSVKKAFKSEGNYKSENKGKQKETATKNNEPNNGKIRKERKKVHFSDEVEVLSAPSDSKRKSRHKKMESNEGEDLVWGKRFTKEEDMTLLKAIDDYIQVKQLGENGREMVFFCQKHKLKGCWKEIASCLPHRPYWAVYLRGRTLLRRNATNWTPEDYENLKRFQAVNGNEWKTFGDLYSKNYRSVKDAWRAIKYTKEKRGHWTQEEYEALFDLVNLDLKLKAFTKEPKTHAVLRDNISWEAISTKLETRRQSSCCNKWYGQLTSTLVRDGLWADTDDYRLILALQKEDASCIEEVDWENILPHRDGEICLKRWLQMVRYIEDHKQRPFIELVEILAKRYCPEMLEYRGKDDEELI